MNKFLILLFIIVLCKLIYTNVWNVKESFWWRRKKKKTQTITVSEPKKTDPNILYNSKLTKDRLQYYFKTINPESGETDYNTAMTSMKDSEKTEYHNLIYDIIADYESEMEAKKALALENGQKQIEEQNAKDTETVLENRDEQLYDLDNVFLQQVQANFNQNYQNNLYIREKNIDDAVNDGLTEVTDKVYGYSL